jgi:hypothetical protein
MKNKYNIICWVKKFGNSSHCDCSARYIKTARVTNNKLNMCVFTITKQNAKEYTKEKAEEIVNLLNNSKDTICNYAFIEHSNLSNTEFLTDYEQENWEFILQYNDRIRKINKIKNEIKKS